MAGGQNILGFPAGPKGDGAKTCGDDSGNAKAKGELKRSRLCQFLHQSARDGLNLNRGRQPHGLALAQDSVTLLYRFKRIFKLQDDAALMAR
jgi:hypothetical protein